MPKPKAYSKTSKNLSEKQKFLSELILMDDIFMRIVLKDRKCTEFILQTILQKPDLKVKTQSIQSDLKKEKLLKLCPKAMLYLSVQRTF